MRGVSPGPRAAPAANRATMPTFAPGPAPPASRCDAVCRHVRRALSIGMDTLALLVPDLALIAIGFALRRLPRLGAPVWDGIETLIYYVLFPSLLLVSILRTPLSLRTDGPAVAVALASLGVGVLLAWLARRVLDPTPRHFAAGAQCAYRFNTYVAFALAQRIGGEPGLALMALIVGFAVPPGNVAAILPLARHGGVGIGRELARNPLIIATVLGIAGNLAGVALPATLTATLGRLGSAAIALGLLAVGAGLRIGAARADGPRERAGMRRLGAWFTVVKLVAMPAFAIAAGSLAGLAPGVLAIVVVFAAVPCATSAYVLTTRLGGDGGFTAHLITVSMLGSLLTLPVWLALLGRLAG